MNLDFEHLYYKAVKMHILQMTKFAVSFLISSQTILTVQWRFRLVRKVGKVIKHFLMLVQTDICLDMKQPMKSITKSFIHLRWAWQTESSVFHNWKKLVIRQGVGLWLVLHIRQCRRYMRIWFLWGSFSRIWLESVLLYRKRILLLGNKRQEHLTEHSGY